MELIQDDNKRQNLLIFMCWLIYVASYIARFSYNSNIVAIKDYYCVTNAVTGLVGTFFFLAYGIGQIINGILCKRYNKKIFLSLPLIISAIINLYLFTLPSIEIYKYLWLINGICLSVLWSLLILTLSENLDEKHMTIAMVVMSSTVAVGTAISYGISSLFNLILGFRYSFLFGFVVAMTVAIVWIFISDKLIAKEGLFKKGAITVKSNNNASIIVLITLSLFGLCMVIGNLVRDGLNTWVPQILKDTYGFSDSLSIILTLALPLVGLLGSVIVLKINKIIKDNVLLNCLLFFISGVCVFGVIMLLNVDAPIIVMVFFGIIALIMYAVNSLITNFIPLQLRNDFNSGKIAGILNGCGYVGSTISAYCLGLIADNYGWNGVFILFVALCFIVAILSLIIYIYCKKRKA